MIKILVVTIRSRGGGAEAVIANFVKASEDKTLGLQIDSFSKDLFDTGMPPKNKLLGYIQFLLALRSRGKEYHFVISGVEGVPTLLCSLAFLGLKSPNLVMWLHCNPSVYLKFQSFKNKMAIRVSLLISNAILCAAEVEVDELKCKGKKVSFLPNILSDESPSDAGILSRVSPKIAFVGSLAILKQPLKTIDILLNLQKKWRINCSLDIYGMGPLHKTLALEIKRNQLADCVKLHGFVSNPWRTIEPGSILLLPSLTEATPMVVIEALHHGCVVISNCYKGHAFFSEHGGLFLAEDFSNIDQVASTIRKVLGWDPSEFSERRLRSTHYINEQFDAGKSLRILRSFLVGIGTSKSSIHRGA